MGRRGSGSFVSALAVSAGLHVMALMASSFMPEPGEAPSPSGEPAIAVSIVRAGPSPPADRADEDAGSTGEPVPTAAAAGAARDASGGVLETNREVPPLPAPKPQRALPRRERPREPASVVASGPADKPTGVAETDAPAANVPAADVPGSGRAEGFPAAGQVAEGQVSGGSENAAADGGVPTDARGEWAAYVARLQHWLEKHKRYPRMAQVRGQEGAAMLRFTVDRDGRVLSHRLVHGTGHAALDREVEAMIERAQPLPAIPEALPVSRLDLAIPVSFRLR